MRRLRPIVTGTLVVLGTILVVSAAMASVAQAQQGETPAGGGELGAMLERVRTAYDPASAARIEEMAASAGEAGVPRAILLDKALEGAAKGVPAQRVLPALARYSERLIQARGILGEGVASSALVAGADALQKGVSPDHLEAVARRDGAQGIAIVVLGDLVDAGIAPERAVEVVGTALDRGRTGQALLVVPAQVRGMLRQGMPPAQAATEIQRRIRAGELPPGGSGNAPRQPGPEVGEAGPDGAADPGGEPPARGAAGGRTGGAPPPDEPVGRPPGGGPVGGGGPVAGGPAAIGVGNG